MQELKKFNSYEELNNFLNENKKITVVQIYIDQERKEKIKSVKFNYCYHLWYAAYDEDKPKEDEQLLVFKMSECCLETIELVKSKVKEYNGVKTNCPVCNKELVLKK